MPGGGDPALAEITMPLTLNWGAASLTPSAPAPRPDGGGPESGPAALPSPGGPIGPGTPGDPPRRGRRSAVVPSPASRRNLISSSVGMAVGTLASRLTGFLRTFVLISALGGSHLADAYNNANTLPNTVYYLMLGGIFTSVIVPLLIKAARHDPGHGEAYAQRMFTLGVVALLAVTVMATAMADPLVDLYASTIHGSEHTLMVTWAYFFIPQIFFYGMSSLIGAVLNTRGSFAAPMWTPVINNIVVIVVGGAFELTVGLDKTPQTISAGGIQLLGLGTTLGVIIQTAALFPALRRVGFRWHPDFAFRSAEVREIGKMAGWMFGYVATQFAGALVVQNIANAASSGTNGYSAYTYAWMLFQLPYAIIGISVITALLPRMSEHVGIRQYSLVRNDFSTGVRLAGVIVVPAAIFLGVLGAPIAEVLFSYGSSTTSEAQYYGLVFGLFSLGLIPYMLSQLQLRVFYAFQDSRTAALVGLIIMTVGIIGDVTAYESLPPLDVVAGIAVAYGIANLAGTIVGWILLVRRVGSLDGWSICRSLARMHLATVPGLVLAVIVMAAGARVLHSPGPEYGLFVTVLGGGGAVVLYAYCARRLRIAEFGFLMRTIAGRFGGQRDHSSR
jgi:murein biosynthesis integral membrane protein MurJ